MVSMKEIAKRCNVSVATVSKALADKKDISEPTREKIRKTAEEMGYMLNASARALKTNRTNNIGVLFVDSMSAGLAHEYFSEILESFRWAAEEYGYDITFINNRFAGMTSTYLNHCKYRNVDGVVIIVADFSNPQILELVDSDIPAVSIDFNYDHCSSVVSDNTKGLRSLVKYAAAKGHRKIAFIHGELTDVTQKRLDGFYNTCRELGISVNEDYVIQGRYHDIDESYRLARQLLSRKEKPTCIIFPDDYSLIGTISRFREDGDDSLDRISVIGYDGIKMARFLGITTYRQDAQSLGQLACKRLVDAIENPDGICEHSVVAGELIEGRTVHEIK
ncbi:MAG: LacI family DNA-binding transcriptional regulator [Erysipelotrichaceae bacterium]|nr:LacI family DNA-binding transcriptional regulator [Erysipelotrichaceae bacterium]